MTRQVVPILVLPNPQHTQAQLKITSESNSKLIHKHIVIIHLFLLLHI